MAVVIQPSGPLAEWSIAAASKPVYITVGSNPTWLTMTSFNKKKKSKNSYLLKANKYSDKMKRINFFNKVNRNKIKEYDNTGY